MIQLKNLNFYLTNGYLYTNNRKIFPYQSIKIYDPNVPLLLYDRVNTSDKLMYGLDVDINPTITMLNL